MLKNSLINPSNTTSNLHELHDTKHIEALSLSSCEKLGENLGAKSTNPAYAQSLEVYNETNQRNYEEAKTSLATQEKIHIDMRNDIQLIELK